MTDLRDAIAECVFASRFDSDTGHNAADRLLALLAARDDVCIVGVTDPAVALTRFGARELESGYWMGERVCFPHGRAAYVLPKATP